MQITKSIWRIFNQVVVVIVVVTVKIEGSNGNLSLSVLLATPPLGNILSSL